MTETTGGRGSDRRRLPSHQQPFAPTPKQYQEAQRHHRLDGEEWEPVLRPTPGRTQPIEEADPGEVDGYLGGAWMRANITTLKKFRHGWLRLSEEDSLVFQHHRIEGEPELDWPFSTVVDFAIIDRDPTPKMLPTGVVGPAVIGYYDAWQVDITNAEGELRMFVLWDAAAVEALRRKLHRHHRRRHH